MTHDIDDEITTEEEFKTALGHLLQEAMQNRIDPKGSWVYRNGASAPDWEIMVHELRKPDGSE